MSLNFSRLMYCSTTPSSRPQRRLCRWISNLKRDGKDDLEGAAERKEELQSRLAAASEGAGEAALSAAAREAENEILARKMPPSAPG